MGDIQATAWCISKADAIVKERSDVPIPGLIIAQSTVVWVGLADMIGLTLTEWFEPELLDLLRRLLSPCRDLGTCNFGLVKFIMILMSQL